MLMKSEERVMHSKSNNIEFMPYNNVKEVVNELFELPFSRYQIGSETSIRGSDFNFQFNCCIINVTR